MRLPGPDREAWCDGVWGPTEAVRHDVSDPAFHVGLGLYETMAVRRGGLLDLDRHLERAVGAAAALGVPLLPLEELRAVALEAARREPAPCGWLKLVATRAGRHSLFTGSMDPEEEASEARAVLLPWRRDERDPLIGVKSLNHASNVLGMEQARRSGADEGLWRNTRGHLTEGCTCNLFVLRGGRLHTAAVRDGILPGVVRARVLQAARRLGFVVHEGKLRLDRLLRADEAFLSSSLRGLRPLVELDGRPVGGGRAGARTARLAGAVASLRRFSAADDRVG